jgi:hypothetical protein
MRRVLIHPSLEAEGFLWLFCKAKVARRAQLTSSFRANMISQS